ncbi:integrating conjugative element protein [Gallibacterium melopsittaci]|uniref:Integrating conjugative element protein n=1 Tax=Gallibacterium melopsittaci TaxID=516063 RepID=A0ABV6HXP6_9PAST
MKFKLSLLTLLLFSCTSSIQAANQYAVNQSGSVLSDRVYYQIGGGSAVMTPPSRKRPYELAFGLGWKANLMCGNFDIKTTVKNQLNGLTEGFKDLMGNIIQSATGAVASMPALIIQRANPQLYDLLTNGVLQGRLDFAAAKTSCEAISSKMADYMADANWGVMAQQQNFVQIASQEQDAVKAKKKSEEDGGKKGINWIGGAKRGGEGQKLIDVIGDVAEAGYNLLNNKPVLNKNAIANNECSGQLCQAFTKPEEVRNFTKRVIGDKGLATCNTCGQQKATAGAGLSPIIEEEHIQVLKDLEDVLNTQEPTAEQLQAVSSPKIPITRGLIEALKEDPDAVVLSHRLASEIALSRVLDKALLARRTILAGMREPNVAVNEKAQAELEKALTMLDREINQVRMEMELQHSLTNNTTLAVMNKRIQEQQTSLDSNAQDKQRVLEGKKEEIDNSNEGNFYIRPDEPIDLNVPQGSGSTGIWNGISSGGSSTSNSNSGASALSKLSDGAYADGRATVYKNADGTLTRREGGSLAWRNNNPGNIKCGDFSRSMGAIGCGPSGFAVFPDETAGEKAIHALLKTNSYNNLSIAKAMERYAPPKENDTELYINQITKATGLDRNTPMSALSDAQREQFVKAIRKHEGWIVGKEI